MKKLWQHDVAHVPNFTHYSFSAVLLYGRHYIIYVVMQALCENLEEQVYRLNQQLRERDAEIEVLRSELDSLRLQHGVLVKALK